MIDILILDVMHILLPIILYLIYIAYDIDKKEQNLAFLIMNYSLLYIIIKYNKPLINFIPLIFINIPLIFAYKKKDFLNITIISTIIVIYLFNFYNNYLLLLIVEYILYFIIYIINKKNFILIFSLIKILSLLVINDLKNSLIIILIVSSFYLFILFIDYFVLKTKQIFKLQNNLKKIMENKQVKTSLFKITHEIKNPIAVCKGYLDMFDINNKEHSKKYIPIIKEEIEKVLLLLEDFLSMNKLKLKKDVLDINLLLNDVIDSYRPYLIKNKIKLLNNIKDDEIYINGDYNRLVQVFTNIIKNSTEAIVKNGIIEVKTYKKRNNIYIYIKDNGKGISKKQLKKIKEPFYTTKKDGNGLGVSLSNEIIEAHNGTLNYKSKENNYTIVNIKIPTIKLSN